MPVGVGIGQVIRKGNPPRYPKHSSIAMSFYKAFLFCVILSVWPLSLHAQASRDEAGDPTQPAGPAAGGNGGINVTTLADSQATNRIQDDNTVLRNVRNDKGELVFFGRMHLWLGGAIQLDSYRGNGLFTQAEGGSADSESYIRRAEGILRASLFKNSEVTAQYDFD